MKKIIYCACIAALATACTNEEMVQENVGTVSRGITFEAAISDNAVSRGELVKGEDGLYDFFWYAEQDRINVYADNVKLVNEDGTASVVENWSTVNGSDFAAPVYKATKSAATGQFTAEDDNNWIEFVDGVKTAHFIATYPTTTVPYMVETDEDGNVTKMGLVIKAANNVQKVAFNQTNAPMYSISTGKRNADYESVGEKMGLQFRRPFPVLAFSSVENNNNYNEILGELKSVSVETLGGEKDAYKLAPTAIGRNGQDAISSEGEWTSENMTGIVAALNTQVSEVTVNLTSNKVWNSTDKVYMNIMPVKRLAVEQKDGEKVDFTEKYKVTYTYANVTLADTLVSVSDWNKEHAVYAVKALDIATDFPYIVTNEGRTLVVFSGNFSDIYNETGSAIVWDSESDGEVDLAEITEIISKVALTDAELQGLKSFTGLEKLKLEVQTSIPENVFDTTLAGQIKDLNLPLVTAIASEDNEEFSALVNLDLSSYAFEVDGIETKFFNDSVKNTLTTLDIAAVTSLRPTFGYERTIVFTDYKQLKSVVLNENGVALTTKAFANCESLETVSGKVDISNAPNVFENAGVQTKTLTVNVTTSIIPNYAFAGSRVKNVVLNGVQVAPTEIGERAFRNNKVIVLMDLSNATKIGLGAFVGAEKFIGTGAENNENNVLTVAAETINSYIFYGTNVKRVQFTNATSLDTQVFGGCDNLKQVKFLKNVTGLAENAKPFGDIDTENIDLFVATAQNDTNGNTWNLVGKTFKSITKEDKAWGE